MKKKKNSHPPDRRKIGIKYTKALLMSITNI